MNETTPNTNRATDNRRHFLVDINTVLNLFGKRYFLIFYFGQHLHPRQREQLINQRKVGNRLAITLVLLLVAGFMFGVWGMIMWRLGQDNAGPTGAGSFTELNLAHTGRV